MRFVPFIRLVGLNGSMLTGKMNKQSDIDFYIVSAPNRLFITRTIVTLVVHLSGWRRYSHKVRGRICLNRFATTEALQITPNNSYHARVFSRLMPLLSINKTYELYLKENEWMNQTDYVLVKYRQPKKIKGLMTVIRNLGEKTLQGQIGNYLENSLRRWQVTRIEADKKAFIKGSKVRIEPNELCFHNKKQHV